MRHDRNKRTSSCLMPFVPGRLGRPFFISVVGMWQPGVSRKSRVTLAYDFEILGGTWPSYLGSPLQSVG
jgi:hypothetical protein